MASTPSFIYPVSPYWRAGPRSSRRRSAPVAWTRPCSSRRHLRRSTASPLCPSLRPPSATTATAATNPLRKTVPPARGSSPSYAGLGGARPNRRRALAFALSSCGGGCRTRRPAASWASCCCRFAWGWAVRSDAARNGGAGSPSRTCSRCLPSPSTRDRLPERSTAPRRSPSPIATSPRPSGGCWGAPPSCRYRPSPCVSCSARPPRTVRCSADRVCNPRGRYARDSGSHIPSSKPRCDGRLPSRAAPDGDNLGAVTNLPQRYDPDLPDDQDLDLRDLVSERSRGVALGLGIVLGMVGGHRFYVGKIGTGLAMLFTFGGLGMWWLYDIILLSTGEFTDLDGRRLVRWDVNDPIGRSVSRGAG